MGLDFGSDGFRRVKMGLYGLKWTQMGSYGLRWVYMGLSGLIWAQSQLCNLADLAVLTRALRILSPDSPNLIFVN